MYSRRPTHRSELLTPDSARAGLPQSPEEVVVNDPNALLNRVRAEREALRIPHSLPRRLLQGEDSSPQPQQMQEGSAMLMRQHQRQQLLGEMEQPMLGLQKGSCKAVEKVIGYLNLIRTCATEAEQIETAIGSGLFVEYEVYTSNDFLSHSVSIEPPSESSLLKPNSSFEGAQYIIGPACLSVPDPGGKRLGTTWPVKVVIHSVDRAKMTLTGTMEASNVPDMPLPSHDSRIKTFLEGEIIDFNLHTLKTKTFRATTRVDSTYWRQLEPFNQLSDKQMVKNLLSKSWINKVLMKHWILMRWKGTQFWQCQDVQYTKLPLETCHVKPSNASLTIYGFYYVSMRRCDGSIQGLYYDPSCTPYQYLSLITNVIQTFSTYCFT